MERLPLTRCPTHLNTFDSKIKIGFYEYAIRYNGYLHYLRLKLDYDWERNEPIKESQRLVLEAMICNDELPIERETIITINLIERIIRNVQFPKEFDFRLYKFI